MAATKVELLAKRVQYYLCASHPPVVRPFASEHSVDSCVASAGGAGEHSSHCSVSREELVAACGARSPVGCDRLLGLCNGGECHQGDNHGQPSSSVCKST